MFPFHCDNPTYRTAFITWALVGINIAVFLWFLRLSPLEQESALCHYGFVPARVIESLKGREVVIPKRILTVHPVLGNRQGLVAVKQKMVAITLPSDRGAIFLSVFTAMFMHGSWMHLIGNMWFLALFGPNIEDRLGPFSFLLFYLFGGFLATTCHWAIDPSNLSPVIGASGAVAALLGAYAITWPWVRVQTLIFLIVFITIVDVPALFVLGAWFLLQLSEVHGHIGLNTSGGVAWWAHIGGFLVGMGLMPLLCVVIKEQKIPEEIEEETGDENPV